MDLSDSRFSFSPVNNFIFHIARILMDMDMRDLVVFLDHYV